MFGAKDTTNCAGYTPLHSAVNPNPETLRVLLESTVDIDARISIKEFLYASIGKAIDLLIRSKRSHRSGGRTAVIFVIHALVIVNVRDPPNQSDLPIVTFSQTLPVLPPSELGRAGEGYNHLICSQSTTGLIALMDLLATQHQPYSPLAFPVEICTQIHQLCDVRTRRRLAATCRAFRAIDTAHPQVDG